MFLQDHFLLYLSENKLQEDGIVVARFDLLKPAQRITRVQGNQRGINACLITQLGLASTHLRFRSQSNPMETVSYPHESR